MDNFNRGEQDRLNNYRTAIDKVKGSFVGLESANAQAQPAQVPAQPSQMVEPAFVGPENVVQNNTGASSEKSNAKVRVLNALNPGYVSAPARTEEQPVMPNVNPFAALRTDETSNYVNNSSGISYVLATILIIILIVLLVLVTLGLLKAFTI